MAKSTRTRRNYTILLAAAAASAALVRGSQAQGASLTWTGGGTSSNWSDPSNWLGNVTPNLNDSLFFGGTTNLVSNNDNFNNYNFNGITFNASAGAFVLTGNSVFLNNSPDTGGGQLNSGGVINNDGAGTTETVDLSVTLSAGRHNFSTNTGSGSLIFGTNAQPIGITRNGNAIAVFNTSGGAINFTNQSGLSNDPSGILGAWATIGNDWATLDGSQNVVAYTGYTDLAAGGGAIPTGNANANLRLTGITTGNSTSPTTGTIINTILDSHTDTTARTLTVTGVLKLGGAQANSGGIYRTGAAASTFTLTGGTVTASGGGELTFSDAGTGTSPFTATGNNLTIASVIANDGSNVVSVNTLGYVVMSATNTFTGGVTIAQGRAQGSATASFGTSASVVTVEPGGQAFLNNNGTYANPFVISGNGSTETNGGQQLGAIRMNTGATTISGQVFLAADARIAAGSGATNTISGKITGNGRLEITSATGANTALQISNSTNDWSGGLMLTNAGTSARDVTVKLTNTGVIPDGNDVTLNGVFGPVTFDINAHNESINNLIAANSANNIVTNSGAAATLTVGAIDGSQTFGGRLTGTNLSINKVGVGTLTLTSASTNNTFAGTATVSNGTLLLNPSSGQNNLSTASIVVTAGTLDVASVSGGFVMGAQTLTNNSQVNGAVTAPNGATVKGNGTFNNLLTLSGTGPTNGGAVAPGNSIGSISLGGGLTVSGGGQLNIEMDGASADVANVTGTVSVNNLGINLSVINNHPPSQTSYIVLSAGTLVGTPTLNTMAIGRNTFSIDTPQLANNVIQIDVGGSPATLRWSNAAPATGDGVSWEASTATNRQNWYNPATGAASPDFFFNNDNVVFNDNNNGHYAVTVVGQVIPGSLAMTNDAGSYSFSGAGSIGGGATFNKSGTAALTIATSGNTYSGGTTINAGTLNMGTPSTATQISLGTGALTLGSGVTIDNVSGISNTIANNIAQTWNGNLTFVGSSSLNMGSGAVTMTAPSTITVNKNTLTVGGAISDGGSGFGITKAGTGTLTLSGASTYGGATNINAGIVTVGAADGTSTSSLGAIPGGNVTVASGATLNLGGISGNNGLNFGTKVFHISGSGFNNLGVITNRDLITQPSGTLGAIGQQNAFQQIVLDGDSRIGGPGNGADGAALARIDVRAGAAHGGTFDLNGHNLTHFGAQKLTFVNIDINGVGNIICAGINEGGTGASPGNIGAIDFESGTQLLDDGGTSKLIYGDGTMMAFWNAGATGATSITRRAEMGDGLAGSVTYIANGGGASSIGMNILLKGNLVNRSTFDNFVNLPLTLAGNITQDATPRKISKVGFSLLELASTTQNTFTGGLEIAPGRDGGATATTIGNTGPSAIVQLDSQLAIDPSNVVSINISNTNTYASTYSGVLQLNGADVTIGGLTSNLTQAAQSAYVQNITGTATLTVNTAATNTFGGIIRDNGGVMGLGKDGSGTLVLTSANTYSGNTTVANGVIQVGTGGTTGTLGTGNLVVNVNDGVNFNHSDNITFAGAISGGGTIDKNGAGSLTLTGTNTHAATNLNGGSLVIPSGASHSGAVNFGGASVILTGQGTIGTVNLSQGSLRPGATSADGDIATMTIGTLAVTGGDLHVDIGTSDSSPGANDGSHDKIALTNGSFTAPATISPFFLDGTPSAGNYTLITSTNAMTHSVTPTVNGGAGSRLTFTPQFISGDTILNLMVSGNGADKTWVGNVSNAWDVNTTTNWSPDPSNSITDHLFFNLDSATFDDSATGSHTVVLSQNVTPGRMVINTASGYTIDTNGKVISGVGAALDIQQGSLVLENSGAAAQNTFGGPISLMSGTTLELQTGGTIGTGAIGATNATLKVNRSGTMTIGQTITADSLNITVDGGGDVTLSGANAIASGNLTVANGTLRGGSATAFPASPANVTLGNAAVSGVLDLGGSNMGGVQNLNTSGTGTGNAITNSSATTNATLTFVGSGTPSVFNGVVTGSRTNLTMTNGTLTLNGNSNASTLQLGDNGGTLTTPVNLAVSGNQTWASFNDTTQTATNTLVIAAGSTLTVTGTFNVVHVASNDTTGMNLLSYNGAPAPGTGGALVVNGAVTIGNNPGGGTKITTTADFSNYSSFTNVATTTTMQIANGTNIKTILTLAGGTNPASSNLINVATINMGTSGGGNANGGTQMNLGGGTNVIDVGQWNIGNSKSTATVQFVTGATSTATVTIAGTNGGTNRANITLDNESSGTGNGPSHLLLAGHNATVLAGTVLVANNAGSGGTASADVSFDTGTFDVNTLTLGGSTSGSAATTGTFNMGTDNTSTGHLVVNTAFNMTNATGGTGAVSAVFNALGGLISTNVDILNPSTRTTTNTFTLNGATLDMTHHNIGTTAAPINFVGVSGVLKNLVQLNGGGAFTKGGTAGGTLVLDGVNTFTGPTNVTNGTLQYNTSLTTSSQLNVSDGARAYIAPSLATPNNVVVRTGLVNTNLAGHVDIGDNKMIVTGVGAIGTFAGTGYTGVTGLVAQGRGTGNFWDGAAGIVTSQSAAVGSNFTSIGVALASDVKPATATATGTWGGQVVTGTDTLVMYTYGGDATLDGKINVDDYIKIDNGIAAHLTGWSNGDFNYDGVVNIDDYTQFIDANIAIQGPQFNSAGGLVSGGSMAGAMSGVSGVSAVPEPASVALVGIGAAIGLLGRRRRRNL